MAKKVELKIEDGIPLPLHAGTTGKGYSVAVRKLAVGQSVLLPTSIGSAGVIIRSIGGNRTTHTARQMEGGCRIWRIK